jgi:hypothetical protein
MPRYSLASLFLLVACAGPRQGEITFPASYFSPHVGGLPPPVPACASPVTLQVTDPRQTSSIVGRRFEEEKPTVEYPIKMQGDPAAYIRSGLEPALQAAGGAAAGKTPANLAISITEIALEEKTFYNAEFRGRIGLDVLLTQPASSNACWSGRVSGSGQNYGKAGNPKNYQETLNRALDEASAQLLSAPGFADALCGKCSP